MSYQVNSSAKNASVDLSISRSKLNKSRRKESGKEERIPKVSKHPPPQVQTPQHQGPNTVPGANQKQGKKRRKNTKT